MGYAISLVADNDSSQPIRALWQQAERFETEPSMRSLNYPPHVTFAIYDEIEEAVIRAAAESVFRHQRAIELEITALQYFDVEPLVLWTEPSPDTELHAIHTAIHRAIDPALCHEHYRPGVWVPHCTVGTLIAPGNRNAAVEFCMAPFEPFRILCDHAELMSYSPLASVAKWSLEKTN